MPTRAGAVISGPAATRARPKSVTRGRPSAPTSTLSGLKSRWTMPAAWAAPGRDRSEEHVEHLAPAALLGREPVASVRPCTNSIATKTWSSEGADVVHGDDVRVRELGHRLGLADQPGAAELGVAGDLGAQQLDRDLAVELRVVRGIDDAHPTGAEPLDDEVTPDRRAALELRRSSERGRRRCPWKGPRVGRHVEPRRPARVDPLHRHHPGRCYHLRASPPAASMSACARSSARLSGPAERHS
jgi:hypothetical protein